MEDMIGKIVQLTHKEVFDISNIICDKEDCSCENRSKIWGQNDGRWRCQAKECQQYLDGGGCRLGKISLTCDNNNCKWNKKVDGYGIYVCSCMDVHLDANGKCYGFEEK